MPDEWDDDLALFAELLPNLERATVTYAKWRRQEPGEYAKWVAFRNALLAGETPDPPVLGTRVGKALVLAGMQHMSISHLVGQMRNPHPPPDPPPSDPPPPPPPPSGTFQNAFFALRNGSNGDIDTDQFHNFGCVLLGSWQHDYLPVIRAVNPDCKIIMYKTASDLRDHGIGTQIPTQANRFAERTTISYNEALVHDANFPSDKWILTTNGTTHATPYYDFALTYGGNFAKQSYRDQWVVRITEQLDAQGWDGVFVDNTHLVRPIAQGWPFESELDTQTEWAAQMASFINEVAFELHAHNPSYILIANCSMFIGGDPASDNGLGPIAWWNQIGAAGGHPDGLFVEYGLQHPADLSTVKLESSTLGVFGWWQNWSTLGKVAQDNGMMGILNIATYGGQGEIINSHEVRYGMASAMLWWDGDGLAFGMDGGSDPCWDFPLTFDLGQPVGAAGGTADSGCYKRQFENGWVAVNPTTSQKTINVGGTNRTISSQDAYIGV